VMLSTTIHSDRSALAKHPPQSDRSLAETRHVFETHVWGALACPPHDNHHLGTHGRVVAPGDKADPAGKMYTRVDA